MNRLPSLVLAVLLGVLSPALLRADKFSIEVHASAVKENKTAEAKYPLPEKTPQPRAVLMSSVDGPITVKWTVRNTEQAEALKDVLVHFFVVKIEKPDQQEVPKLTRHVLVESALTMDFRPQDKNEAEITFTVANPGCYLLRLELKGAALKEGREHFAALDLLVR